MEKIIHGLKSNLSVHGSGNSSNAMLWVESSTQSP
jgi:hypothetical protein